jgi:antitoxin component YwqK of YwqJK toxin-antitoxin module
MKYHLFIVAAFLGFSLAANGQDVFVSKEASRNAGKSIELEIGCGIAGQISEEIRIVKNLVRSNDDTDLVKLISSDNVLLQLLSIVAIDNIQKKRNFFLTEPQKALINEFELRKDVIGCCRGCTDFTSSSIKKIFKGSSSGLRGTIDYQLGQYRPGEESDFTSKDEAKNEMKNGLKEGKWFEYNIIRDDTGRIDTVGYILTIYKNGLPFGTVRTYDRQGKLRVETPYANGKKNGTQILYKDGIVRFEYPYSNDQENGIVKEFDENGKLICEIPYVNGVKNGAEKVYYPNGKIRREAVYNNGKTVTAKIYDENGNEIK